MFRWHLLALALIAAPVSGAELTVPGLSPDALPQLPACTGAPGQQSNCVRVLACIGDQGLWFDGQARGWNKGSVAGHMSDGTTCTGTWTSGALFGTGYSRLSCSDGSEANVVYHTIDNETGTVIGTGRDSLERQIKVWTGLFVLDFLTDPKDSQPKLPCGTADILLS